MIRALEPRDLDETLRVFRASCGPSHPFLPPSFIEKTEKVMRERTLLELETAVVDEGGIRGFLCRKGSLVEALFVDPLFQGQGHGRQLLDHVKRQTPVAHLYVFARNSRAIKFYHREEFWAVKVGEHRETGETNVLLKWQLSPNHASSSG